MKISSNAVLKYCLQFYASPAASSWRVSRFLLLQCMLPAHYNHKACAQPIKHKNSFIQDYDYESTPDPIKIVDVSVEPPMIMEHDIQCVRMPVS